MWGVDSAFCMPAVTMDRAQVPPAPRPPTAPPGHLWDGSCHIERNLSVWSSKPGLQRLHIAGAWPILLASPQKLSLGAHGQPCHQGTNVSPAARGVRSYRLHRACVPTSAAGVHLWLVEWQGPRDGQALTPEPGSMTAVQEHTVPVWLRGGSGGGESALAMRRA